MVSTVFIGTPLIIFVFFFGTSVADHDLLLLIGSSLCMLAKFLFLRLHNRSLCREKFGLSLLDGFSLNVSLAPGLTLHRGRVVGLSGRTRNERGMLLCLLLHDLFVLSLIHLLGSLFVGLGHLLTHDLSKSARATRRIKPLFGLGLFNWRIFGFFQNFLGFNLLEVRSIEHTLRIRLPVSFI